MIWLSFIVFSLNLLVFRWMCYLNDNIIYLIYLLALVQTIRLNSGQKKKMQINSLFSLFGQPESQLGRTTYSIKKRPACYVRSGCFNGWIASRALEFRENSKFYKLMTATEGTTINLCSLFLMLKTVQIRTRAQKKGLITNFKISVTIHE